MTRACFIILVLSLIIPAVYGDEDEWGDWDKPNVNTPPDTPTYGVGLKGKDEILLNQMDGSSLLDYPAKDKNENNQNKKTPVEQDYFFLKKLEDELLEDFGN